jgi:negative regulator of flagellin synthesis FlgM
MIISGKQIQSIMKVYAEQSTSVKSSRTQSGSPVQKKDEVILSTKAQEFGQIYQAIKAMPEVREDKVKELSERIERGDYSVDAKEVAEKMLGRIMADRLR